MNSRKQGENEAKFKFQGEYARSQRWFDLDLDWIEVNFSTSEPDLYKKLFRDMIFFTSIGILIASFELSLRFFIKSYGKISDSVK